MSDKKTPQTVVSKPTVMFDEIRQNGVVMLSSDTGHTIPIIFRMLQGIGMTAGEHKIYLRCVAFPMGGFVNGEIEHFRGGKLVAKATITEL